MTLLKSCFDGGMDIGLRWQIHNRGTWQDTQIPNRSGQGIAEEQLGRMKHYSKAAWARPTPQFVRQTRKHDFCSHIWADIAGFKRPGPSALFSSFLHLFSKGSASTLRCFIASFQVGNDLPDVWPISML